MVEASDAMVKAAGSNWLAGETGGGYASNYSCDVAAVRAALDAGQSA